MSGHVHDSLVPEICSRTDRLKHRPAHYNILFPATLPGSGVTKGQRGGAAVARASGGSGRSKGVQNSLTENSNLSPCNSWIMDIISDCDVDVFILCRCVQLVLRRLQGLF